ncbi:MAG: ribosomal protein S18-alanine N-acetyltransferase [Clostridia bacterium]
METEEKFDVIIDGQKMQIVDMQPQHIDMVVKIEQENFSEPWSFCAVDSLIENRFAVKRVCVDESGEVVGYYSFAKSFEDGFVNNIAVKKSAQNKGVGKALMTDMFAQAEKNGVDNLTLEVRPSNGVAVEMYKKLGFVECGKRRQFYPDKEDATIMWKTKVDKCDK